MSIEMKMYEVGTPGWHVEVKYEDSINTRLANGGNGVVCVRLFQPDLRQDLHLHIQSNTAMWLADALYDKAGPQKVQPAKNDFHKVVELVVSALSEDAKEDSRFDQEGWSNFFHEDWKTHPEAVEVAFERYDAIRDHHISVRDVIREFASESGDSV